MLVAAFVFMVVTMLVIVMVVMAVLMVMSRAMVTAAHFAHAFLQHFFFQGGRVFLHNFKQLLSIYLLRRVVMIGASLFSSLNISTVCSTFASSAISVRLKIIAPADST